MPLTISAAQVAVLQLSFQPSDYGRFSDTLLIFSNDPVEGAIEVVLEGTGVYADRFLSISPNPINFGVVRAEPVRDGSRHLDVKLINRGGFELTVTRIYNGIPDIFDIEQPTMHLLLAPADTFLCRIWFTPHRNLQYLDTLIAVSNGLAPWTEALMRGSGDGAEVRGGEVLWERQIEAGRNEGGAVVAHCDVNGDGIREVIAVGATGGVICINGFASEEGDIIWEQRFEDYPFSPEGIAPRGALAAGAYLGGNRTGDILFGSGSADDASVYALNGASGQLLWRWDGKNEEGAVRIARVVAAADYEGDGAIDPVIMAIGEDDQATAARLEGRTGRTVWSRAIGRATILEPSPDVNGDGLGDYVSIGGGRALLISGEDGSIINRLENLGDIHALSVLDRAAQGTSPVLILGVEGGARSIDARTGIVLWNVNAAPNEIRLGDVYFIEQYRSPDETLLALGGEGGSFTVVDDIETGHVSYGGEGFGPLASLAWAKPYRVFREPSLITGLQDGRVIGMNGDEARWVWDGEVVHSGAALNVIDFDDIDFGGTSDAVALTADGVVRCLSSGGDLAVGRAAELTPTVIRPELYPNPFNGRTRLLLNLAEPNRTRVEAFDVLGRSLGMRDFGLLPAGLNNLAMDIDAAAPAGGVVYYRIATSSGWSIVISGRYIK